MEATTANVSMIHHVPELIVSDEVYAKFLRQTVKKLFLFTDICCFFLNRDFSWLER